MDALPYRYVGVPLTATIAAKLALELFDGQVLERRKIIDGVVSAHAERGGVPSRTDVGVIARHALSALRAEGRATNVSTGHWQIGTRTNELAPESTPHAEVDSANAVPVVDPLPSDVLEIGEGPEAVYLYFLPTYRLHAEANGRSTWPCKIGRTSGDPLARVAAQAATALPEPPRIAALLWTTSSQEWERAFHGVLAARKRRVLNALGVEWFDTSPAEFIEIAVWIDPSLGSV